MTQEQSSPLQGSSLEQARQRVAGTVERITELVNSGMDSTQEDVFWGRMSGTEEDVFWRRLSDAPFQKDVLPSTFLELHNQCYEAYNANPLAFAVVEITTSFVLGKGVKVCAKNRKVQQILDAFWNDVDNHMESRIYDLCTELSLYGELFVRFFVNPFDGRVKVRLIDPSLIDEIETDPEDVETQLRFHQRAIAPNSLQPASTASLSSPVDPTQSGRWLLAGEEVAHFAINKVSNAKRGKSDLATLLPWLRRYKDWLTDRVRMNKYKGAFLWDVTLRGADAKTVRQKKMEYSYPPEPGTVIIHNEAEQWQAVRPEIHAQEAKEDGRAIKLMVAVGATIPEHFLSDGAEGNQATATQMGLPTFLKFQRRQQVLRTVLRTILDRVLREAQRVGRLSSHLDVSKAYDVLFPEFDHADNQALGSAVSSLMQGLQGAKAAGWISDVTAMQLLFQFCGLEVDVHEERARIRTQATGAQSAPLPTHGPLKDEQGGW